MKVHQRHSWRRWPANCPSSPVGGILDIVEDNKDGLLVRFAKIFTIFFITLLALHSTVVCTEKKRQIGIGVGQGNYTNRDDLASPMLHQGRQKTFDLSYTYKGTKTWHWIQIGLMMGEIQTSSLTSSADHYYGHIQYGYARLISRDPVANMVFWLGGSWNTMGSARSYLFIQHTETERKKISGIPTGTVVSTLNINLLSELLFFKKQKVIFSIYAPVLGFLLRNGYAITLLDITNQLISLNTYQSFRFSSRYEHTLAVNFKLCLTYWFFYQRYSLPRKTISVFHGLRGGISFQF